MGRINVTSSIFEGPSGPNCCSFGALQGCSSFVLRLTCDTFMHQAGTEKRTVVIFVLDVQGSQRTWFKLTWLVLGGDPAARSHRVEQLTAL